MRHPTVTVDVANSIIITVAFIYNCKVGIGSLVLDCRRFFHHATDSGAAVLAVAAATWADAGAVEEQVPRVGGRAGSRGPVVAVGTLVEEAIVPGAGENTGPSTPKLPTCIVVGRCRTSS